MQSRFLKTQEVADYLGVSMDTIAKARTSGVLLDCEPPPFVKRGMKFIRYKAEDVVAFADAMESQMTHGEPTEAAQMRALLRQAMSLMQKINGEEWTDDDWPGFNEWLKRSLQLCDNGDKRERS